MSVCSLEWIVAAVGLAAVFFFVPGIVMRQVILAVCNVAFVSTFIKDLPSWTILVLFTISGYAVARLLIIFPRKLLVAIYLTGLIFGFVILKQYAFMAFLHPASLFGRAVSTVGLSYLFFRQIHFVVDVYQKQIQAVRLWDYLNYQLNIFGFVAGPIQRYQEFCACWERLTPILKTPEEILRAFGRLSIGILKITVVAAFFISKFDKWLPVIINPKFIGNESHAVAMAKFCGVFYSYPLYVYFNFSGYSDMVIAAASLLGIRMPENFDRPYLSRNMIEFWTRWHRSLGFWIRDYLFTPLYRAIAGRWPKSAASWAFLCYFIALFVAGVWHGSTWNFVVFGLLNGIGVAAARLWENWIVARRGRQGLRKYLQSRPVRIAAVFGTLNFVCICLLFVGMDIPHAMTFLKTGAALARAGAI